MLTFKWKETCDCIFLIQISGRAISELERPDVGWEGQRDGEQWTGLGQGPPACSNPCQLSKPSTKKATVAVPRGRELHMHHRCVCTTVEWGADCSYSHLIEAETEAQGDWGAHQGLTQGRGRVGIQHEVADSQGQVSSQTPVCLLEESPLSLTGE